MMTIENLIDELNKRGINLNQQQLKAALHKEGPHLVMACPGSGKTTTLVVKLYVLIKHYGLDPRNILTMTFSRAAARDMENRFYRLFPNMPAKLVRFSTIHSFAYSVISNYERTCGVKYILIENNDMEDDKPEAVRKIPLLKRIYLKITGEYISEEQLDTLMSDISFVSNKMIPVSDFVKYDFETKEFKAVYCAYKDYKRDNRLIDFDDMLTLAYSILQGSPKLLNQYRKQYQYICLDEGQDTSAIQFKIVKLLAEPLNNLCIIGDDDQTLYTWRGAEPDELLNFKQNYPEAQVYYMETNYRSNANIVEAANSFIQYNKARYNKNMTAAREKGDEIMFLKATDETDYAKQIINVIKMREHELSEYAVLFRNNNSAIVLADQLEKNGIPYFMKDTKPYLFSHWVTLDILAFMRLGLDDSDHEAFERIYYKMDLYLSKAILEYVKANGNGESVFRCICKCELLTEAQKDRVERYEIRMKAFYKLDPAAMIDYTLEVLQYEKFLMKNSEAENDGGDNYYSIINSLRSIAVDCRTVQAFFDRLGMLERDMQSASRKYGKDAVILSTMHSSKGCEYKTVFMSANQHELPSKASMIKFANKEQSLLEEERRVFYVGMTRAKLRLFLYTLDNRNGKAAKPSQFYEAVSRIARPNKRTSFLNDNTHLDALWDTHTARHYNVNTKINHKFYGHGFITEIKRDKLAETCVVRFGKVGIKQLDMKFCLEGNIVTIID